MTGVFPVNEIDHKDRIKDNNKWFNLRDVTRSINCHNRSTWGEVKEKGICMCGIKYRVRITTPTGKRKHVGVFSTLQEAISMRDKEVRHYKV